VKLSAKEKVKECDFGACIATQVAGVRLALKHPSDDKGLKDSIVKCTLIDDAPKTTLALARQDLLS
jgi:hypothetical protein